MTFVGPKLQVFLGRNLEENIPGNQLLGHFVNNLNIVPARDLAISLYFVRVWCTVQLYSIINITSIVSLQDIFV